MHGRNTNSGALLIEAYMPLFTRSGKGLEELSCPWPRWIKLCIVKACKTRSQPVPEESIYKTDDDLMGKKSFCFNCGNVQLSSLLLSRWHQKQHVCPFIGRLCSSDPKLTCHLSVYFQRTSYCFLSFSTGVFASGLPCSRLQIQLGLSLFPMQWSPSVFDFFG